MVEAQDHYLVSYGSLLSRYSRQHFSGINAEPVPVVLKGWQRSWSVRYSDESATYAGIQQSSDCRANAVLLPLKFDQDLKNRERGYEFVEVDPANIEFVTTIRVECAASFWVARSNSFDPPDKEHPLPQTYVDTCLTGCLEVGGREFALDFIRTLKSWDVTWINDRKYQTPIFPRRLPLSESQAIEIDDLLFEAGVLGNRDQYPVINP